MATSRFAILNFVFATSVGAVTLLATSHLDEDPNRFNQEMDQIQEAHTVRNDSFYYGEDTFLGKDSILLSRVFEDHLGNQDLYCEEERRLKFGELTYDEFTAYEASPMAQSCKRAKLLLAKLMELPAKEVLLEANRWQAFLEDIKDNPNSENTNFESIEEVMQDQDMMRMGLVFEMNRNSRLMADTDKNAFLSYTELQDYVHMVCEAVHIFQLGYEGFDVAKCRDWACLTIGANEHTPTSCTAQQRTCSTCNEGKGADAWLGVHDDARLAWKARMSKESANVKNVKKRAH